MIESVDFNMTLLCDQIRNIKLISKETFRPVPKSKKKHLEAGKDLNNRNIVNSLQSYDILESLKYAGCNEIKQEISNLSIQSNTNNSMKGNSQTINIRKLPIQN